MERFFLRICHLADLPSLKVLPERATFMVNHLAKQSRPGEKMLISKSTSLIKTMLIFGCHITTDPNLPGTYMNILVTMGCCAI